MIQKSIFRIFVIFFVSHFSTAHDWRESRERDPWRGPYRGPPYGSHRFYGFQTTPSPQNVCPCVKRKDTGQCMTYDARFQAVTVEEAIVNFPDLQINGVGATAVQQTTNATAVGNSPLPPNVDSGFGPQTTSDNLTFSGGAAKSRVGPKGSAEPFSAQQPIPNASAIPISSSNPCGNDRQCQECSSALLNRLNTAGLLRGAELDQVSKQFGSQQIQRRGDCEKYRFGRRSSQQFSKLGNPPVTAPATPSPTDAALDLLVKQLQDKGEENWKRKQQSSVRTKRQGSKDTSKQGSTLGQQFKIDCSKRGEPVETGSSWVGLCNVCWAWRKLPASYFPQYVNELICDADTKCMSGWGSCQQRYKSVDILQNTGSDANPTWKQVTISVANYCDCEVESGSSMHNFVAA